MIGWLKSLRPDWFLSGMVIAVFLAWLFPEPGARGGWLHPEILTKAGVALVFFLHGLSLSFQSLRHGILQWRLHLVVQLCCFVLFPVLGLTFSALTAGFLPESLRIGFIFLCAIPSTVSSSVALTAAAHGNVPAAVFNATISSLLGVVVTPLWMTIISREIEGESAPLGPVIMELVIWLVLPLTVGQLMRPWFGAIASRNRARINTIDRLTILMLIYTSFCDSMIMGIWTRHGGISLIATVLGSIGLFYAVFSIISGICSLMHFSWPDRIAVLFCGSKKSLANGIPMSQLMFGSDPGLGLILLPVMIYHSIQLVICGVLAGRWAKRSQSGESAEPQHENRSTQ